MTGNLSFLQKIALFLHLLSGQIGQNRSVLRFLQQTHCYRVLSAKYISRVEVLGDDLEGFN